MSTPNKHVQQEREVVFLVSPKAHFVSLVGRGANQTPFRVVKTQEKQGDAPVKVLQSLIVPAGMDQEAVCGLFDEDVRGVLKFDKALGNGKNTVFEQYARSAFKAESLELVTLDEKSGVLAVRGELSDTDQGGVIAKLFKPVKKAEALEISDDLSAMAPEAVVKAVSDAVYGELYRACEASQMILFQESTPDVDKVAMVQKLLLGFVEYLTSVLPVTKGAPLIKPEPVDQTATPNEEPEMTATKDETPKTPEQPQVEPAVETVKSDVPADPIAALTALIEPLVQRLDAVEKAVASDVNKSVQALAETVAKLEKAVPAIPSRDADDVEKTEKSDRKPDVFAGVLGLGR